MEFPAGLQFHHVGVACADIDAEARRLAPLGYVVETPAFVDRRQGVRGTFVVGSGPRLELLEPLEAIGESAGGVLTPWLNRDVKLYHLAFQAPSLPEAIESLRRTSAKLVVAPVPAVAFAGREIAFMMLPNMLLVELIAGAPA